jgi:hypothetical protein
MAYYFALTSLPPIAIGEAPGCSFKEARQMLKLNLSRKDVEKVELLVRPIDLYNLKAIWLGIPLDELDDRGNYSANELQEALLVSERLPQYLVDFLQEYESAEERLRYFPRLLAALFREEGKGSFLGKYFALEREIRLVLTALRAKLVGRDVAKELQFEDPHDPFVAQILAQKDAPDYTPPREYEELKTFFLAYVAEPQKLHQAVLQYRFSRVEELESQAAEFGIDRILGYLARLLLVEDGERLKERSLREKGTGILEQLSEHG